MSRKAVTRRQRSRSSAATKPQSSATTSIVVAAIVVATASALLLVDPRAQAAFDAPKRLGAMLGIALAAACALATRGSCWAQSGRSTCHRLALLSMVAAVSFAIVSTLVSPRRGIAIDALRAILLFASVLIVGAAAELSRRVWTSVTLTFVAASAVNAVVSVLQTAELYQPFRYATTGGRANTSAFIGNDGVLALTMALAALVALDRFLSEGPHRGRVISALCLALTLTALVLNRGISPVGAFAGGAAVVALIRIRQRRQLFVTVASAVAIAMIAIAAYAPMRERFVQISRWKAAGDWNAVTSYRLVPWAAASEMFLARPLLGWGPGTFATEFVPHLVRAEVRWRTRLVHPFLVGSYAEAHSDYLQSLAELGAPAVLFALIAAGITMYSCARSLAKPDARAELSLPISIAVAGAIAALTWLPLQQPATALLLLAAFGRAWRISLDSGTPIP